MKIKSSVVIKAEIGFSCCGGCYYHTQTLQRWKLDEKNVGLKKQRNSKQNCYTIWEKHNRKNRINCSKNDVRGGKYNASCLNFKGVFL